MDKLYQIITELWPLIDIQNCLVLNTILTNGQILIFFCYKISDGRVCCMPAALLLSMNIRLAEKCSILILILNANNHINRQVKNLYRISSPVY